jgi:hypothetical protein
VLVEVSVRLARLRRNPIGQLAQIDAGRSRALPGADAGISELQAGVRVVFATAARSILRAEHFRRSRVGHRAETPSGDF